MSNPSLSSNTVSITIRARNAQLADDYQQKYDAVFNAANNYTQTFVGAILSMHGEDVVWFKTTLPSRLYRCKFDDIVVTGL